MFHQGAGLTSASCLDFLVCESCQSRQADGQTDKQADRQPTQWSRNTRRSVAAMDTLLESLYCTHSVCLLYTCVHAWDFGNLEPDHCIKNNLFHMMISNFKCVFAQPFEKCGLYPSNKVHFCSTTKLLD